MQFEQSCLRLYLTIRSSNNYVHEQVFKTYSAEIRNHGRAGQQHSDLFETGATIPFISRYRKEATGSLDEVQIGNIRELYEKFIELDKRRATIIDTIAEQGNLTDELKQKIEEAETMSTLEDLYLPFRPKRKTRASVAIERGLQPLAALIIKQQHLNLKQTAQKYISEEKGLNTVDDVLAGARDIIAEKFSESANTREFLRQTFIKFGRISSKKIPDKIDEGEKYKMYYKSEELISKTPSHRLLAMFRGEDDGILRLHIAPYEDKTINQLRHKYIHGNSESSQQVDIALTDAYHRLLQPQMETEMRKLFKDKADKEAISVFSKNARQLLLAAPLGQKTTPAIDPDSAPAARW